ncbi:MAG: acyltransferase 3 [Bacteroidetes bacterium]|jgi:peptidoglycan/LPS O-acetylase OafA/YrhL|nr:acyltransferase 3 [Bacteroidota bacterium]MDF2452417.1 acyltransferase 3 [Bacteroidota bacterium]
MLIKGYPKNIKELDGLRGIACLLVLIHHCFTGVLGKEPTGLSGTLLDIVQVLFVSGVDLFYVLSGFLVGGIIIDNARSPNFIKVFFIRRVCRIFPIYYLLILSFAVGLYFFIDIPWTKIALLKNPYPIWTYFTYLQSYFFGLGNNSGPLWVAVTWSVSVEEQFYLLMPFVFLFLGGRRALFFVICGIIVAPFIRYFLFHKFGFYAAYMMFPGRMDSIFWGVLLAFLLRSEKWRSLLNDYSAYILSLIVVVFALLAFHIGTDLVSKFTLLAIFYTGIIWAVLEGKLPRVSKMLNLRFFTYTGLISYAIYMFHQLINCVVHGILFHDKPVINGWDKVGATFLSIGLLYILCSLSLRYFEKPIRDFGAKFHYKSIS